MKLLEGKNALVFGLANKRSIAWGITQAFHEHGANIGISYAGEVLKKRAVPLADSLGIDFVESCDVSSDEQIAQVAEKAKAHFGEIDIIVHAIAFANRDELTGPYYDTSREGFRMAMDISVYSFVRLSHAFQPLLRKGASLMTLTYYGAEKVVPSYNVMGVAKAALEASTRYMARDFGPQGIRVNAISAGPIRTLAAAGVGGFKAMHRKFVDMAPLRQEITIEDVGGTAVYLASDLSAKTTGEVIYVDSGYNIIGIPENFDDD
ncbi:MAG: enoyl-ACP reductase [Chloroflexi bacterium]|jgi:enoyl-[acyl-carrier protein] reductase I|nr:enoyl-ACP reductase [Chloroflexota bacterium]MBT3671185.1 enoyl-ACP reductase [Chloroflexota bacterium]MBT4002533.1 enoyl-ACP reductase [Chloroflexota bacterium]MBT4304356.1 enoyl-ACP reductase [Chloroflexota bacterium]MBT4534375.1 enoyl-ACP reductase [Chloroflexota bacterium]